MLIWWYMFALRDVPFLRNKDLDQSQFCLRKKTVTFSVLFDLVYQSRWAFCFCPTAAAARELFQIMGRFCFVAFIYLPGFLFPDFSSSLYLPCQAGLNPEIKCDIA